MLMPGCLQSYDIRSPGETGQSWEVQMHRHRLPAQHEGETPLAGTHHGTLLPMLGQCSVGQEPMQLQSPSQKRTEEPEALFFAAEVAKHTVLLPGQLLMESSHPAAVNLLSLQEEICQTRHYSRKLSIPGN